MKFQDLVVTINVNLAPQSCMAATVFAKSACDMFVFKLARSLQRFLFIGIREHTRVFFETEAKDLPRILIKRGEIGRAHD